MAAGDHLGVQFEYDDSHLGSHSVHAIKGGEKVGSLDWNAKGIKFIGVNPEHQRQGIATEMFHHAQGLASSTKRIPQPKHSADRTNAGSAWAKSVGGSLPRQRHFDAFDQTARNLIF